MTSLLLLARYMLFGLFVICNAIICISAVWNHSLTTSSQTLQIDIYLAFLGAFGLVFAVTLIFVEVLFNNPFTTRIWFESGWVAVFWLMELSGAAAVSALTSNVHCSSNSVSTSLCISQHLLLAFTWICTGILLAYFFLVVFTTVTCQWDNQDVWNSTVRHLHSSASRQYLSSLNSPSTSRFKNGSESLPAPVAVVTYAPKPIRPAVRPAYFDHDRAGLGSEYEIERFKSPPARQMTVPEQMVIDYRSSLREAVPIPLSSQTQISTVRPLPRIAPLSIPAAAAIRPREDPQYPTDGSFMGRRELPSAAVYPNEHNSSRTERRELPVQPSPLGNWPRRDIMEQPVTHKRRNQDSLLFSGSTGVPRGQLTQQSTETGAGHRVQSGSTPSQQPGARRPSGPRLRLPSNDLTVTSQRQVPP
ncbi:hypothetical protein BKA82DRAFT_24727 [Pisolithus tinctorius]|uniref:MARVEL domain-containing protein n=1 Tax=Pisolithus tinctorius Marx 270 TaxID=870435 RepID=A0A0C3JBQ5_PISTI|nr:hypothetical protein BKA82DRAFT_24727 [Pisolithus tinctorius]KIO06518.1 hypothetical protein M404DRAFT_24727 [Pisolithus tinctorius Marx 270]